MKNCPRLTPPSHLVKNSTIFCSFLFWNLPQGWDWDTLDCPIWVRKKHDIVCKIKSLIDLLGWYFRGKSEGGKKRTTWLFNCPSLRILNLLYLFWYLYLDSIPVFFDSLRPLQMSTVVLNMFNRLETRMALWITKLSFVQSVCPYYLFSLAEEVPLSIYLL